MPPSKTSVDPSLRKLPKAVVRKAGARRVRQPWRRRVLGHKLNYAERKALLEKRLRAKLSLRADLKEVRDHIWAKAVQLREKHGNKHTVEYYYRTILYQCTNKNEPQAISMWNAFVSKEYKAFNDGKYTNFYFTQPY